MGLRRRRRNDILWDICCLIAPPIYSLIYKGCKNEECRVTLLFLLLEVISFTLDLLGGSHWGYLLASFVLSTLIVTITIYVYFIKRSKIRALKKAEAEQLFVVEIVFAVLQLFISGFCLIRTLSGVNTNYSASVFPLAYAIIAVGFAFRNINQKSDSSSGTSNTPSDDQDGEVLEHADQLELSNIQIDPTNIPSESNKVEDIPSDTLNQDFEHSSRKANEIRLARRSWLRKRRNTSAEPDQGLKNEPSSHANAIQPEPSSLSKDKTTSEQLGAQLKKNQASVNRNAKVEELVELKKKTEAADVAKAQFLATVSHEIRTPMNGVLELDVTQQDYVRTAQASGKALLSLIPEVLDQPKVESSKLELEAMSFDLRATLDDVLSLLSGESQEKGVELAVNVSDQVPDLLIGDPGRFQQIITNLMGNSIKFTDKGHIFITVNLVEEVSNSIEVETLSGCPVADRRHSWKEFRSFSQDGLICPYKSSSPSDLINLVVSVEDTGEGIPFEAQPRIFFMQVGPSISPTYGGTGIGLSVSKYLVNRMNGEIGFVSVPKIGSTFTFTAVFTNGSSNSNGHNKKATNNHPNTLSSEFQGMVALVVDPRPIRAKVSRYHIQRLGIHVEIVSDLSQDISRIGNGNAVIDIVFVEQEVWERDARRKFDHWVPSKLFLLANSISSSRTNAITSGLYYPNVIMKPLRASMLAASLQGAMGIANKGNPRNGEIPSVSLQNLLFGRKILVVDDNKVNLRVAAGALKKYGANVVCAVSGQEAIKKLQMPHQFDACFMDIHMPEMDGFETTRRIRDMEHNYNNLIRHGKNSLEVYGNVLNRHLPILAVTADVIQSTHEECLKCGMDGYVSKPFEAEQLYREVSRYFHQGPHYKISSLGA